ncbi:protein kinase domain-containing protein [Rhodococcus koreensis]
MSEDDPLGTRRYVVAPAGDAELEAAGFENAQVIGHGGFGIVYRCEQPDLDRTVAVKILSADLDEENRTRFFREQRAMGRLTGHPNIVTVLQVGSTGSGRPYLVMPYHPQDSLDTRIRRHGPLPLAEALQLGVKMAGAVETAHRLEIVHRDVKPGNILLTDYREPALTDFGIAHIAGGFRTGTGTVSGSPAFTAPEVLAGDSPTPASDVYGLGATLFSALTGHAAYERRSGEQVVAQFLRITTQPVPDLRERGIPDDVSETIARAMSANPQDRPTAAQMGDELRRIQLRHGFPVDEMALPGEPGTAPRTPIPASGPRTPSTRGARGNLPAELTSFVDRRTELTGVKRLLSTSRLVTLTGVGGVGKTRLALRAADTVHRAFSDGVWLVELGELSDASLVADVVAATLGLRNESARTVTEILVDFLAAREPLLVLDNCEQVVDAAAGLAEKLLRTCPGLRILATSREPLGIDGEATLRVPPLTAPDPDQESSLQGMPRYDAITLFADRAATVLPEFELTEDNKTVVAQICHRLDGLPLPIELAAARLRAMSPEQVLQRLTDRFALLTRGSRSAPPRQQTLRLCIDWSFELCSALEQRVWAQLSVFAGSCELDAAEALCGRGLDAGELLDAVTSLVDKSILIRETSVAVVRFRLLETLREYGREKAQQAGEYLGLRRQHREWYRRLVLAAEADWISSRQLEWISRLEREQPNLREAMEFCVSDSPDTGLQIAAALYPFWNSRGLYGEGRRWLDRLLELETTSEPTVDRIKALYADAVLAELQGDLRAAAAHVEEGRALAGQTSDPMARALIAHADGILALFSRDLPGACSHLENALATFGARGDRNLQIGALHVLGLTYDQLGDSDRAIESYAQILEITEARGESVFRSNTLWSMAVAVWRRGDRTQAVRLLEQALQLARQVNNPSSVSTHLEALAWIAAGEQNARHAVVLLGAAEELSRSVGSSPIAFPHLRAYHTQCQHTSRRALGVREYEAAHREGQRLGLDAAIAYALGEQAPAAPTPTETTATLTKRERQVADLIAEGLTNKAIAARLVISPRTAQGHVEHVLTKLGFTSRAQIAAWVVEQTPDQRA